MWATWLLESADHAPIECGFFWANAFTGAATRRSELPSRNTGFTALPSTFAYRARTSFSASVCGSSGKSGTANPFACSSSIAATSCGMDALMFGSLMMFASGVLASSPNSVSASGMRCSSVRLSGKLARMRPASEMSFSSNSMPELFVNARRIGSSDCVASAGASSVLV